MKLYYTTLRSEEIVAGRRLNPYYPDWLLLRPEHWPQPYSRFRADFEALFAAIAAQSHERLVVVLFPMRAQVFASDDELIELSVRLGGRPDDVDRNAIGRFVSELASRQGVTVIDCLELFRTHENPKLLYQSDNHLSAAGMRLVVEEVLRNF